MATVYSAVLSKTKYCAVCVHVGIELVKAFIQTPAVALGPP